MRDGVTASRARLASGCCASFVVLVAGCSSVKEKTTAEEKMRRNSDRLSVKPWKAEITSGLLAPLRTYQVLQGTGMPYDGKYRISVWIWDLDILDLDHATR